MLNFKLKDPYTILYKEEQEIKLLRDKDGVLNMITPNNQEELNRDIRDYFLKNPFARLLENLSRRDISIANIITMYHFLSNVNRNYDILNEQFKINKDKDYKAILAVRQKDGISIDKEHMKLLWYQGEDIKPSDCNLVLESNYKKWCEGFTYMAIPLKSSLDFLAEINK